LYTYLKKSDFAFLAVIPKKWPRPLNFEHIKSDDAGIYFGIQSQFLNPPLKGFLSVILLLDFRHLDKISVLPHFLRLKFEIKKSLRGLTPLL
jgi:hypothetical protein